MNTLQHKSFNPATIFDRSFIDLRSFYLAMFDALPNVNYIGQIDGEKLYRQLCEEHSAIIRSTHTYRWFEQTKKKYRFDRTVLVLDNHMMLECDEDHLYILHDGSQMPLLDRFTAMARSCKVRERRRNAEVSLIVKGYDGLELRAMEIRKTRLDVGLYYEDDFKEVDELIRKRLNKKEDKGIVLLHGLPGTGKTTYLRYLVGRLKKRVLFLSPDVAGYLIDPSFIQLLIDNPDSVIIVEDAENLIMDRRSNSGSSVSNLLNISDGLMSDFLNVQLICTFNSELTLVDQALMRKGRLIARYEFGKLSVAKAQRLSDKLGLAQTITEPMTIAEITHPQEKTAKGTMPRRVIGFRRTAEQMID